MDERQAAKAGAAASIDKVLDIITSKGDIVLWGMTYIGPDYTKAELVKELRRIRDTLK